MIEKWGKIVLVFLIGVLFGFLSSNYQYFVFDSEINIIDLVNLLVSIVLAIYISIFVADKKDKSKIKKEFILKEVSEISLLHKQLKNYTSSNIYPFEPSKALFKEMNLQLKFIEEILESSKCQSVVIPIKQDLYSLRRMITGLSPEKGSITLDRTVALDVESKLRNMKTSIYNLLVFVIQN